MSDEAPFDQATYDRQIAAGVSEGIARARARAAAVREAAAGDNDAATSTATTVSETGERTREQRAARVAASLGNGKSQDNGKGNGKGGSGHSDRLLALVPPPGIQQVSDKQQDKVYTWPHLLINEFVALLSVGSLLMVVSFFLDATFRNLANPNLTPDPSKAPWYFLGLQELLRYFHPMVAGVTIPGVGLIMLGATAFFDKNPSAKPENRKFATMALTFFLVMWTVFVLDGSFFRGPGFNWVWPWTDGLYFEL